MMPQPRILSSRRSNLRSGAKTDDEKTPTTVVTIDDSANPDFEYINIDDDHKDIVSPDGLKFADKSSDAGTSSKVQKRSGNASDDPNILMVLPVRTPKTQIQSPNVCTLKKIVDPKEISQIKRAIDKKQKLQMSVKSIHQTTPERSRETLKKVTQAISTDNSVQTPKNTTGNQAFSVSTETVTDTKETARTAEQKKDNKIVRNPNILATTSREINSPIRETKSDATIESSKKSVETLKTSDSRQEKNEDVCRVKKDVSDSKQSHPASKKLTDDSDNSDGRRSKISSSGASMDNAKLLKTVKVALSMPKIPAHGVNSINNQKSSNLVAKKRTTPTDSSKTPKNSILGTALLAKIVENENSPKITQTAVSKIDNSAEGSFRNVECIVCKKNFTDRTELHRHATLAHPNVQMLFCGHCTDSFLTHSGLEAHRAKCCNPEIGKIYENGKSLKTTVAVNESKPQQPLGRAKRRRWRTPGYTIDRTRKTVKIRELKRTLAVLMGKSKNVQIHRTAVAGYGPKRGRPRKNFHNFVTKYAEKEVVDHTASTTKNELGNAAIMKLVIPMPRLEGPELEKYMQKRAEQPVTVFRSESENKSSPIGTRSRKRRWRSNSCNKIVNVRRITRYGRKFTEVDKLPNNLKSAMLKIKKDRIFKRERTVSAGSVSKSKTDGEIEPDSTDKPATEDAGDDGAASERKEREKNSEAISVGKDEKPIESVANSKATDSVANSKSTDSVAAVIDDVAKAILPVPVGDSLDAVIDYVARLGGMNSDDDSSQEYRPISVDPDGLGTNERPIIRKLTSRSSAASFALLRNPAINWDLSRGLQALPIDTAGTSTAKPIESVNWATGKEKFVVKNIETPSNRIVVELPEVESFNDMALEEFDPEQFGNVSKDNKKYNVDVAEKNSERVVSQQRKIDVPKASILLNPKSRKTYLPSKRKTTIATTSKHRLSEASLEFCSMCKELFALMKQLASQFRGNKAKRMSVKCPLCNLYFISMFYLEEHLATYHLHCQSKVPCKKSKTVFPANSSNDNAQLDCETEINLTFECHRCSMKFGDEKDLNDHIFTQHDAPPFCGDSSTNAPHYLNNLQSSCCQTLKNWALPPDIERSSDVREPKSVSNEVANKSPENTDELTIIPLSCSICYAHFFNRSEYVCHVTEVHNFSTSSSTIVKPVREDRNGPNDSGGTESRPVATEIPAAETPTGKEQITADREYLLKQLLSDDSRDGVENMETGESGDEIIEIRSTERDNNEANKTFDHGNYTKSERPQKLPADSLKFGPNVSITSQNGSEALQDKMVGLFADPPDDNLNDAGSAGSSAPKLTAEKIVTVATAFKPMDEDIADVDDIFASATDNDSSKHVETVNLESSPNSKKSEKLSPWALEKPFHLKVNVGTSKSLGEKSEILKSTSKTEKPVANVSEDDGNGQLPIECAQCNRKFPNQTLLNEHIFYLHDDHIKAAVLTDISHLDEKNSTEPKQWRCNQCSHNFKSFHNYGRHRYFVHSDDELVHVCENCCKVLTSVTIVNVHICADVTSYNCRTCNITFPNGLGLRLHNTDKHLENKGPHVCKPCNKKFLTNGMLKRHEKWKHRFLRTYKPQKTSPVHLATAENVYNKLNDDWADNEMDSGCDQGYVDVENELAGRQSPECPKDDSSSPKDLNAKSRETPPPPPTDVDDPPETKESSSPCEFPFDPTGSTTYIDEDEIYQCNLCQLYCLSKAALRTHKIQCHSCMAEICRVCKIMYSKGKLIRHMIDHHVNPCDTYVESTESIWDVGKSVEEKDAEELIKILGMRRLISLCEYQRYRVPNKDRAITCPTCGLEFANGEMYKHHFLMNHDFMCALCNIEFKSGDKAALHKIEDHGSAGTYIWFVDKTVTALTAATNFTEVAEQTFMDMISRDSDESSTVSHDDNDESMDVDDNEDDGNIAELIDEETGTSVKNVRNTDEAANSGGDSAEVDDTKLIIVVTDEDLKTYGIGTHNPNIWGLASKISSTSNELTPTDVKGMLDSYFGR